MAHIEWTLDDRALVADAHTLVVVARKADLLDGWPQRALPAAIQQTVARLAADLKPGTNASATTLLAEAGGPKTLAVIALFDKVSRHLSPTRAYEIFQSLRNLARPEGGQVAIVAGLSDARHALAVNLGIARSYPLYSRKSGAKNALGGVRIQLRTAKGALREEPTWAAGVAAVRNSGRLVDMPTQELDTAVFEAEARAAVAALAHVSVESIVGDDLLSHGLRGLHAVGRTAMVAPRVVLLDYNPPGAAGAPVALIGKGLVYDTGGLSLKIVGDRMLTMKCDMGGAAAVLGAFTMLAQAGGKRRVIAALAMAENAIGPDSYRPDDIIEMHSGKTMEVNNTDAEGRIALADAASYVARKYAPDVLIDAATLTGAQLIATGKWHAAIVSNDADLEARVLAAGLASGDHCMPILFSPEYHIGDYKSNVADMRNSVADRSNAPSSASGLWVWLHLDDLDLRWAHIDLAGPAFIDNRGSGYGVGLIFELVRGL